jgi:glycosyltransferase involved in cell wall biosynthesis
VTSESSTARVTVCIPTYNRAQMLRSTLKGVLDQGYDDIVVVVSDNGSEDETSDVVTSIGDPRIRYVRRDRNYGALDNINYVLTLAETEFVVLLPDDDGLLPGGLQRAVEALDRYPNVGVVHSALDAVSADGDVLERDTNWLARGRDVHGDLYETGPEFIVRSIGVGCRVCQSTAVVRRELLPVPAFGLAEEVPLDLMMWLNVALKTDFLYIDQRGGFFRRYDESLSGRLWRTMPDGQRVLRDDFVLHLRDVKLEWIDQHESELADPKLLRRLVRKESGDTMLWSSRYESTRRRSLQRVLEVVRLQPDVVRSRTTWRRVAGSLRGNGAGA